MRIPETCEITAPSVLPQLEGNEVLFKPRFSQQFSGKLLCVGDKFWSVPLVGQKRKGHIDVYQKVNSEIPCDFLQFQNLIIGSHIKSHMPALQSLQGQNALNTIFNFKLNYNYISLSRSSNPSHVSPTLKFMASFSFIVSHTHTRAHINIVTEVYCECSKSL